MWLVETQRVGLYLHLYQDNNTTTNNNNNKKEKSRQKMGEGKQKGTTSSLFTFLSCLFALHL